MSLRIMTTILHLAGERPSIRCFYAWPKFQRVEACVASSAARLPDGVLGDEGYFCALQAPWTESRVKQLCSSAPLMWQPCSVRNCLGKGFHGSQRIRYPMLLDCCLKFKRKYGLSLLTFRKSQKRLKRHFIRSNLFCALEMRRCNIVFGGQTYLEKSCTDFNQESVLLPSAQQLSSGCLFAPNLEDYFGGNSVRSSSVESLSYVSHSYVPTLQVSTVTYTCHVFSVLESQIFSSNSSRACGAITQYRRW